MNALLTVLALIVSTGIAFLVPNYGGPAVLVCAALAILAVLLISRIEGGSQFLVQIFVAGLLVRMLVGSAIFAFHLESFFGGDALTYSDLGYALLAILKGQVSHIEQVDNMFNGGGWGMLYIVAAIYSITGRNMLAVQFFNAVIGAATAPVMFLCSHHIFRNLRVARITAFFVAFFPSLVLWSSQGLKDAPIVFLLAVAMLATLKLGERLSVKYFIILIGAMSGLLTLRFYILYMVAAAVGGAFVIGMRAQSTQSLLRQFVIVAGIGLTLTYLGVLRNASAQFERFGSLESVQQSRLDQAQSAKSGFGSDVDVSTTSGAISAIPTGLVYLLFAPFPWQLATLRQSITLPEMVVWWCSFPLLVIGLWFTLKYRFRQSLPILIFTSMLTLAYSIFQGNVGTAYRQRSQVLVFYFIFVVVGLVLLKERREERQRRALVERQRWAEKKEWRHVPARPD